MHFMKIKCFQCHENEHYVKNCQQKKASKKETIVAAVGEALASQFELDFTLIACMAGTVMGGMWYLYSCVSFHMMGNRDLFNIVTDRMRK